MKPIYGDVLIQLEEVEEQTAGGIFLPSETLARENSKLLSGHVIAIGPDVREVALLDKVLFRQLSGTSLKIDGKQHVIIKEDYIQAIIESEEDGIS